MKTIRKCRTCSAVLKPTRYFKCEKCQPILKSIDDAFIYETPELDEFTVTMIEGLEFSDHMNYTEIDGDGYSESEDEGYLTDEGE